MASKVIDKKVGKSHNKVGEATPLNVVVDSGDDEQSTTVENDEKYMSSDSESNNEDIGEERHKQEDQKFWDPNPNAEEFVYTGNMERRQQEFEIHQRKTVAINVLDKVYKNGSEKKIQQGATHALERVYENALQNEESKERKTLIAENLNNIYGKVILKDGIRCYDAPNWKGYLGHKCDWYGENSQYCNRKVYNKPSPLYTPNEACCACDAQEKKDEAAKKDKTAKKNKTAKKDKTEKKKPLWKY